MINLYNLNLAPSIYCASLRYLVQDSDIKMNLSIIVKIYVFFFQEKMDRAGSAEFAIDLWIPAKKTFFAHIDLILHALIGRFFIRMVMTKGYDFGFWNDPGNKK